MLSRASFRRGSFSSGQAAPTTLPGVHNLPESPVMLVLPKNALEAARESAAKNLQNMQKMKNEINLRDPSSYESSAKVNFTASVGGKERTSLSNLRTTINPNGLGADDNKETESGSSGNTANPDQIMIIDPDECANATVLNILPMPVSTTGGGASSGQNSPTATPVVSGLLLGLGGGFLPHSENANGSTSSSNRKNQKGGSDPWQLESTSSAQIASTRAYNYSRYGMKHILCAQLLAQCEKYFFCWAVDGSSMRSIKVGIEDLLDTLDPSTHVSRLASDSEMAGLLRNYCEQQRLRSRCAVFILWDVSVETLTYFINVFCPSWGAHIIVTTSAGTILQGSQGFMANAQRLISNVNMLKIPAFLRDEPDPLTGSILTTMEKFRRICEEQWIPTLRSRYVPASATVPAFSISPASAAKGGGGNSTKGTSPTQSQKNNNKNNSESEAEVKQEEEGAFFDCGWIMKALKTVQYSPFYTRMYLFALEQLKLDPYEGYKKFEYFLENRDLAERGLLGRRGVKNVLSGLNRSDDDEDENQKEGDKKGSPSDYLFQHHRRYTSPVIPAGQRTGAQAIIRLFESSIHPLDAPWLRCLTLLPPQIPQSILYSQGARAVFCEVGILRATGVGGGAQGGGGGLVGLGFNNSAASSVATTPLSMLAGNNNNNKGSGSGTSPATLPTNLHYASPIPTSSATYWITRSFQREFLADMTIEERAEAVSLLSERFGKLNHDYPQCRHANLIKVHDKFIEAEIIDGTKAFIDSENDGDNEVQKDEGEAENNKIGEEGDGYDDSANGSRYNKKDRRRRKKEPIVMITDDVIDEASTQLTAAQIKSRRYLNKNSDNNSQNNNNSNNVASNRGPRGNRRNNSPSNDVKRSAAPLTRDDEDDEENDGSATSDVATEYNESVVGRGGGGGGGLLRRSPPNNNNNNNNGNQNYSNVFSADSRRTSSQSVEILVGAAGGGGNNLWSSNHPFLLHSKNQQDGPTWARWKQHMVKSLFEWAWANRVVVPRQGQLMDYLPSVRTFNDVAALPGLPEDEERFFTADLAALYRAYAMVFLQRGDALTAAAALERALCVYTFAFAKSSAQIDRKYGVGGSTATASATPGASSLNLLAGGKNNGNPLASAQSPTDASLVGGMSPSAAQLLLSTPNASRQQQHQQHENEKGGGKLGAADQKNQLQPALGGGGKSSLLNSMASMRLMASFRKPHTTSVENGTQSFLYALLLLLIEKTYRDIAHCYCAARMEGMAEPFVTRSASVLLVVNGGRRDTPARAMALFESAAMKMKLSEMEHRRRDVIRQFSDEIDDHNLKNDRALKEMVNAEVNERQYAIAAKSTAEEALRALALSDSKLTGTLAAALHEWVAIGHIYVQDDDRALEAATLARDEVILSQRLMTNPTVLAGVTSSGGGGIGGGATTAASAEALLGTICQPPRAKPPTLMERIQESKWVKSQLEVFYKALRTRDYLKANELLDKSILFAFYGLNPDAPQVTILCEAAGKREGERERENYEGDEAEEEEDSKSATTITDEICRAEFPPPEPHSNLSLRTNFTPLELASHYGGDWRGKPTKYLLPLHEVLLSMRGGGEENEATNDTRGEGESSSKTTIIREQQQQQHGANNINTISRRNSSAASSSYFPFAASSPAAVGGITVGQDTTEASLFSSSSHLTPTDDSNKRRRSTRRENKAALNLLTRLLGAGASVKTASPHDLKTPLHIAVERDMVVAAMLLLREGSADPSFVPRLKLKSTRVGLSTCATIEAVPAGAAMAVGSAFETNTNVTNSNGTAAAATALGGNKATNYGTSYKNKNNNSSLGDGRSSLAMNDQKMLPPHTSAAISLPSVPTAASTIIVARPPIELCNENDTLLLLLTTHNCTPQRVFLKHMRCIVERLSASAFEHRTRYLIQLFGDPLLDDNDRDDVGDQKDDDNDNNKSISIGMFRPYLLPLIARKRRVLLVNRLDNTYSSQQHVHEGLQKGIKIAMTSSSDNDENEGKAKEGVGGKDENEGLDTAKTPTSAIKPQDNYSGNEEEEEAGATRRLQFNNKYIDAPPRQKLRSSDNRNQNKKQYIQLPRLSSEAREELAGICPPYLIGDALMHAYNDPFVAIRLCYKLISMEDEGDGTMNPTINHYNAAVTQSSSSSPFSLGGNTRGIVSSEREMMTFVAAMQLREEARNKAAAASTAAMMRNKTKTAKKGVVGGGIGNDGNQDDDDDEEEEEKSEAKKTTLSSFSEAVGSPVAVVGGATAANSLLIGDTIKISTNYYHSHGDAPQKNNKYNNQTGTSGGSGSGVIAINDVLNKFLCLCIRKNAMPTASELLARFPTRVSVDSLRWEYSTLLRRRMREHLAKQESAKQLQEFRARGGGGLGGGAYGEET